MIDRFEPYFGPFSRSLSLRQMMDRLFDQAFVTPQGAMSQAGYGGPALNVYEEGDNYVVETQLPGLKPEDIDITLEQGVLTIRGETKREQERKERNYLVREHHAGSFSRSLRLPYAVNADEVQATYEHGVLRLSLPKAEEAKPRRIQLSGGGQAAIASPEGQQAEATPAEEHPESTQPVHDAEKSTRSKRHAA